MSANLSAATKVSQSAGQESDRRVGGESACFTAGAGGLDLRSVMRGDAGPMVPSRKHFELSGYVPVRLSVRIWTRKLVLRGHESAAARRAASLHVCGGWTVLEAILRAHAGVGTVGGALSPTSRAKPFEENSL
jgi:hypothetical protein